MKVLSGEQMRALDRHCIDDLGIPGLELMERAGHAVAEEAFRLLHTRSGPAVVLCGKGNNGGDGFVAARLLREQRVQTHVYCPFPPEALSGDARAMYARAVAAGVPIITNITDTELEVAGIVIDALLGTGVTGPVRGELGDLITRVNAIRQGYGVLAVDLPSGVDADTGQIYGPAIQAEFTVTMALPKPGLLLYPGAGLAGQWTAVDIGFPPEVLERWPAVAEIPEHLAVSRWIPRRGPTAHKRSVGWALIIAGSYGMTGAAAMACLSAYRNGVGLVRLALPASLVPPLNAALTEVVFRPIPQTPAGTLSFKAVAPLLREAEEVQAVLIGPGLSRNAATANAVRRLVAQLPCPLVVDADALSAMAGHEALWQQRTAPTIITPHPGEMSRLLGRSVKELEADRLDTAREAARRCNAVTVYKGAPTVIAAPDGRVSVSPTGNAGLAVAGTGDVLAGAIVAMLAQGVPAFEAAGLATYVGGLATEHLTADIGLHGMTALDLIDAIPRALVELGR